MPSKFTIWTEKDDKVLKELYPNPKVDNQDLCRVFPNKSLEAIRARAYRLGLQRPKGQLIDQEYLAKLRKVIKI